MKKALKIIAIIVAIFIVLYTTAAIVLSQVIKPSTYKSLVSKAVYKATHRKLQIKGKLDFSFFPWIGVRVNNVQLDNPANFNTMRDKYPYFASVGQADIKFSILPLVIGDIDAKKIELKNTTINLLTAPSGVNNWQDLFSESSKASKPQASQSQQKQSTKTESSFNFAKMHIPVSISNANVNWINQQTNKTAKLENFNLNLKMKTFGSGVSLNTSFKFEKTNPNFAMTFKASADTDFNLAEQRYQLNSFDINGNVLTIGEKLKAPIPFILKASSLVDLSKQIVTLKQFVTQISNMQVKGSLSGQKILQAPVYKGVITLSNFNLQKWLRNLKMNYQPSDSNTLKNVSADIAFSASPKFIKVPTITANVDKSKLTGNIDYANLPTKNLHFTFQLNSINLDNYLPAKSISSSSASNSKNKRTARNGRKRPAASSRPMKLINWEGTFKAKAVILKKLQYSNVDFGTFARNNIVTLSPLFANVASGSLTGKVTINEQHRTPSYSFSLRAKNLSVQQLVKSYANKSPISGRLNSNNSITTSGSGKSFLRNMNGSGSITIGAGKIHGININKSAAQAKNFFAAHKGSSMQIASLKGKAKNKLKTQGGTTAFSSISASYRIRNGILYSNNIRIVGPKYNITGSGSVNLYQQSVSMNFTANLSTVKWPIPLTVTGPINKPHVAINVGKLIGTMFQDMLNNAIKKGIDKNIGKDLLKGLFGR